MGLTDPLRAEVMAQPAPERLGYALDLLAFYLDPVPEFYQGCARLGLALSRRDCQVLQALDRRRGRFVSLAALHGAAMVGTPVDDWTPQEALYVRISKLRRRLRLVPVPISITGWRRLGFRLNAPDGWQFETAGQAAAGGAP